MATTTNFGWTTPNDTDLVKDGAAAIRTALNGVDTSLVDLKGGTTGQVLAKASNTDLDYTWSSVDPLVILDAKGDLISATAADTPARLAVGTNGQILTADSTASTGLKWASPASSGASWSLANPTGTSLNTLTTRTVSGLSADKILIVLDNALQSGGSGAYNRVIVNGLTTSIYKTYGQKITPGATYAATILANYGTAASAGINLCLTSSGSAPSSGGAATITGCASSGYKQFQSVGSSNAASGNSQESYVLQGIIEESSAITSVAVTTNATWTGGNMYVYVSN